MTVHGFVRHSIVVDNRRAFMRAWQDRFRAPGLTVLLILQLCLVFVAAPLAAKGLPIARPIIETMVLAVVVIVVMLSHRPGAIGAILPGLAAMLASILLGSEWSPAVVSVLRHGGNILTFSALTWVLSHVVYAPGRITFHRLQGAGVLYLNVATIFASAFSLIWELNPAAFANLAPPTGGPGELATMLYFSLTDADHYRLRRHRGGRPIRPQFRQSGGGSRTILSRDHGCPARNAGTGRSAPLTCHANPTCMPSDGSFST